MEHPPIFVRIEQYKDLVKTIADIERRTKDAERLLAELRELKAEEDARIAAWDASLGNVSKRSAELRKILGA